MSIDWWWSWLLAAFGLAGLWVAGSGQRIGWAIGALAQLAWIAYAVATQQWGFIATAIAYATVYWRNFLRDLKKSRGSAVATVEKPTSLLGAARVVGIRPPDGYGYEYTDEDMRELEAQLAAQGLIDPLPEPEPEVELPRKATDAEIRAVDEFLTATGRAYDFPLVYDSSRRNLVYDARPVRQSAEEDLSEPPRYVGRHAMGQDA